MTPSFAPEYVHYVCQYNGLRSICRALDPRGEVCDRNVPHRREELVEVRKPVPFCDKHGRMVPT